ncbi:hypothetical protein CW662_00315 [Macrococcoides caseolyticum]|uniref:tail assembly chaperone n=1 Tax=Macrococcoides caseolyticum TaxID=69966 RepID=UPI000C32DB4A|nr:tail assembly chaperone [Macrococcus caseolyticus]PKE70979.1 hypothetical protein CW662_00315 [Macrococcus caseolyticus]
MTEAIKVLTFGRKVDENGNVSDYGKELQARGTFWFNKVGKEKYEGKGDEVDFFTTLYNGLINMDETKLVEFWVCATAYLRNNAPTEEEIMEVLQNVADEKGMKPLFKGALEVLEYSGFFKDKVAHSWEMMFKGAKLEAKKEAKKAETEEEKQEIIEEAMEQVRMLQEMKDSLLEVTSQA